MLTKHGNPYLYLPQKLGLSTGLLVGVLLNSKQCDHTTSPFLRIYYMVIYYTITGDVDGGTLRSKSMDSPGQQFLNLLVTLPIFYLNKSS